MTEAGLLILADFWNLLKAANLPTVGMLEKAVHHDLHQAIPTKTIDKGYFFKITCFINVSLRSFVCNIF